MTWFSQHIMTQYLSQGPLEATPISLYCNGVIPVSFSTHSYYNHITERLGHLLLHLQILCPLSKLSCAVWCIFMLTSWWLQEVKLFHTHFPESEKYGTHILVYKRLLARQNWDLYSIAFVKIILSKLHLTSEWSLGCYRIGYINNYVFTWRIADYLIGNLVSLVERLSLSGGSLYRARVANECSPLNS